MAPFPLLPLSVRPPFPSLPALSLEVNSVSICRPLAAGKRGRQAGRQAEGISGRTDADVSEHVDINGNALWRLPARPQIASILSVYVERRAIERHSINMTIRASGASQVIGLEKKGFYVVWRRSYAEISACRLLRYTYVAQELTYITRTSILDSQQVRDFYRNRNG